MNALVGFIVYMIDETNLCNASIKTNTIFRLLCIRQSEKQYLNSKKAYSSNYIFYRFELFFAFQSLLVKI